MARRSGARSRYKDFCAFSDMAGGSRLETQDCYRTKRAAYARCRKLRKMGFRCVVGNR